MPPYRSADCARPPVELLGHSARRVTRPDDPDVNVVVTGHSDLKRLINDPGAWLPIVLALAALIDVVLFGFVLGPVQQADGDEGTPAHVFQGLMVLVATLITVFAIRWLPREPREAATILALQVLAAALPLATLALLESRATG
jgi:hypothetical protein